MKNVATRETPVVSRLFIDKATFTYRVEGTLEKEISQIQKLIREVPSRYQLVISEKGGVRYRLAYAVRDNDGEKLAFIQVGPYQSTRVNGLRVVLNPNKSGLSGCKKVFKHLSEVFGVSFLERVEKANCTQLDFAVDVWNVYMEGLEFVASGKQYSSIWNDDLDKAGKLVRRTVYIGAVKSNSRLIVYDKSAESKESGKQRVRIELRLSRLRNTSLRVLQHRLGNPFAGIMVTSRVAIDVDLKGQKAWFLDSCRVRGAQAALKLAKSRKQMETCKDLLATGCVDWFFPDRIWAGLPNALEELGPFLSKRNDVTTDERGDLMGGGRQLVDDGVPQEEEDEEDA